MTMKRGSAIAADPRRRREPEPAQACRAMVLGVVDALDAPRSVTLRRHGSRDGGCVPAPEPRCRRRRRSEAV